MEYPTKKQEYFVQFSGDGLRRIDIKIFLLDGQENAKGRARSAFSFCLKMGSYKICGQVWGKYVENCVENGDNRDERVSSI